MQGGLKFSRSELSFPARPLAAEIPWQILFGRFAVTRWMSYVTETRKGSMSGLYKRVPKVGLRAV